MGNISNSQKILEYSGQPLIKMMFSQENVLCEVSIWKREDKLRLTCFDS